jgi:di/tricarboxylate transporter
MLKRRNPRSASVIVCLLLMLLSRAQIIPGITGVNLIGLWSAAILTGGVMLLIGCLTPAQALASIDWPVYITIAFAFGLGTSMDKSGVARAIADIFVALSEYLRGGDVRTRPCWKPLVPVWRCLMRLCLLAFA